MTRNLLKNRAYQRRRRRALFAKGLCTWCGRVPPADGRTRCEDCCEMGRASARKLQARRRAAALALGMCRCCCDRQAMPRRSQCAVCAEARDELRARHRAEGRVA
jgi:hypothetical protein